MNYNTLDQVVVTEQGVVVVTTDNPGVVVVNTDNAEVVITGIMGPPGSSSLSNMVDVDRTDLTDGATLVYKASTQVWRTTNTLDNQILEAGQF